MGKFQRLVAIWMLFWSSIKDCDSVASSTSLQHPTQSVEPPLKVFSQPPTANQSRASKPQNSN